MNFLRNKFFLKEHTNIIKKHKLKRKNNQNIKFIFLIIEQLNNLIRIYTSWELIYLKYNNEVCLILKYLRLLNM
jgi:hypothetical protein